MERKSEVRNIALVLAMVIGVTIALFGIATFTMTTYISLETESKNAIVSKENPYLEAFQTAQTIECYRLLSEYLYQKELISIEKYSDIYDEYSRVFEEIYKEGKISKVQCKRYNQNARDMFEIEQKYGEQIVQNEEMLQIQAGTIDKVGFLDGLAWGQVEFAIISLRENGQITEKQYEEYQRKKTETYIELLEGGNHISVSTFFDYVDELFRQCRENEVKINGL